MEVVNPDLAKVVFGGEATGTTLREHASTSSRQFVRSQDHLSLWKEGAKGRILSALQAFDAFGFPKLIEAVEFGTAVLPPDQSEPATTLKTRREALGLTAENVAQAAGVTHIEVQDSENPRSRVPIRLLERICASLGLDERLIGFEKGAGGDSVLAVRLKTLGSQTPGLPPRIVSQLAEASWVARTQSRLESDLTIQGRISIQNSPDSNYGSAGYPAWQHGYWLASKTRQLIGLANDEPIHSMRDLCSRLGFPVIQAQLPGQFAGATVANMDRRAIVVNTEGFNSNVWVRRATLAHELAHLLWDPDERLQRLRVDEYTLIQSSPWDISTDYVEARANAFSVEFLAPAAAIEKTFNQAESNDAGVRNVMHRFGISATAAKYHIWNTTGRKIALEELIVHDVNPGDEWLGPEDFTLDYFPIKSTPALRRGEFSAAVVASEMRGMISEDTASSYLCTTAEEYRKERDFILQIFPNYSL